MALTANQRTGISINSAGGLFPDTPIIDYNAFSQGYSLPKTTVNTSVEDAIKDKVKSKEYIRYQFPLVDFPKYNFTLIENDVNVGGFTRGSIGALTPEKVYKFPLPEPLVDVFSVQYKQDFSFLNAAIKTGEFIPTALLRRLAAALALNPVGAGVAGIGGLIAGLGLGPGLISGGIAFNRFNTVTLDSAFFREFELNWKFVPRNYSESKKLQSIITSLKRGSAPRFAEAGGFQVPGFFRYPKVYTMFFQPNVQFLFKFKPCVLRGITIHYDGGAGAPSFYKPPPLTPAAPGSPLAAQQNENNQRAIQNSPPESIIINTNWMEIELWSKNSYKDDPNLQGMPSPNPLDAINDDKYIPESDRRIQPQPVGAFERQLTPGELSNLPGTNQ